MSAIDDYLKLAGLSPQWRQGFYVGSSHGLLNPLADEETKQGYEAGKKLAGKTLAVILATVREQYTIDPVSLEVLRVQAQQQDRGRTEHGTTLYDANLYPLELLNHAIEEAADQLNYLVAMKIQIIRAAL